MEYRNQTFTRTVIILDGNAYFDCKFNNCQILYQANTPVHLEDCEFSGSTFVFDGHATLAIDFIRNIAMMGGEGRSFAAKLIFGEVPSGDLWIGLDGVGKDQK